MEVSLAVTQETTYEVELHGGFRFDQWLVAGRVEEEFDSLDEILEDEKTLRQLFLVHDSVDYMCDTYHDTQKVNEDYTKIFTCDLAAKWINLSDYALDKFYANEGIKAFMDTADKYGYGEWCLMPQVPTMTSDTAPYGEASASNENRQSGGTIDSAFKAFDGSTSTYWRHNTSQAGSATDPWLAYHFTLPVCIRKIRLQNPSDVDQQVEHFIIQASNDGENWTNISEELTNPSTRAQITDYEFANANEYSYYRVFVTSTYTSGLAAIAELQFFGVDYSEKEFEPGTTKKWLYDHGLLLNGLTLYKGNQTTSSKPVIKNDELVCGPLKGTESWNNYSCAAVNIDLLPHSLFRAKVGRYASGSTNSEVGRLLILDYISDGATLSAGSSYNVSELNTPIKSPNTVSLNVATYYEQKAVIASVIFNNNRLTSYKELWLE